MTSDGFAALGLSNITKEISFDLNFSHQIKVSLQLASNELLKQLNLSERR